MRRGETVAGTGAIPGVKEGTRIRQQEEMADTLHWHAGRADYARIHPVDGGEMNHERWRGRLLRMGSTGISA